MYWIFDCIFVGGGAHLACLSTPLKANRLDKSECLAGIALLTEGLAIPLKNKKIDEAQKAETVLSAVRYSSLV